MKFLGILLILAFVMLAGAVLDRVLILMYPEPCVPQAHVAHVRWL